MVKAKADNLKKRGEFFSDEYRRQHILFAALMLGGMIFAIWKTFYGSPSLDESFYLTIPHRYSMGDVPFADEWHLSAMTGFLQLPFVWIYTHIFGTEGIILASRIFYVFIHAATAVVIYSRVYKKGILSIAACLLLFIFAPYNIMQLCYNSMGIDLIVLSGILLATANYRSSKAQLIISGVCLAGAVLCCPYFASAYAIYAVCVLARALIKKFSKREHDWIVMSEMFSGRSFLFLTIGVFALSLVFIIFLFTRMSLSKLFESIPYMLSDPEHQSVSLWNKLMSYNNNFANFDAFLKASPKGLPPMQIPFIIYLVCFAAVLIERSLKNGKRRVVELIFVVLTAVTAMYSAILVVLLLTEPQMYGGIGTKVLIAPLIPIALAAYALSENRPKGMFAAIFIPALTIHDGFIYIAYAYYVMLFVLILDKKRMQHRQFYLVVTAAVSIATLILLVPDLGNMLMFPLFFIGLTSYILCEKKDRELYAAVFLPGILYTFCIHMGSNQVFNVISMAFTVVNVASCLFLAQLISELSSGADKQSFAVWTRRTAAVLAVLAVVFQLGLEVYSKATEVFLDAKPAELTAQIPGGPAKGIKASPGSASYQTWLLKSVEPYSTEEPGNILFMTTSTVQYLAVGNGKFPYGTYSAWLSGENNTSFDRLKSYFKLNPEKTPKYIYLPKSSGWDKNYILPQLRDMGYSVEETDSAYMMKKLG